MLRTFCRRQLTIATRDPGLRLVLVGYLLVLLCIGLFLLTRALAGSYGLTMQVAVRWTLAAQWILAAALTPWSVLQIHCSESHDRAARLIAQSGAPPWQAVAACVLASWGFVLQLLILSLPLLVLLPRLAAVSAVQIGGHLVDLSVFVLLVVLVTAFWEMSAEAYLDKFALSYLSLAILAVGRVAVGRVFGPSETLAAMGALSVILGLALLYRGHRRLFYLEA